MKKILPLPILTVVLGFGGYVLRRWQLATAFEEETGLLRQPGVPATWLLLALAAVTVIAAVLLSLRQGKDFREKGYLRAFGVKKPWAAAFHFLSAVFLLAAGVLGLLAQREGALNRVLGTVLGVCLVLTGLSAAVTGALSLRKTEGKGRFAWSLLVPGYCGCVWLVYAYQGHTANPNIMEYVFLLLGIVLATLGCYAIASFSFEKPRAVRVLWLCPVGFVFLAIALADLRGQTTLTGAGPVRSWSWEALMTLGYMLYLFIHMTVLLARTVEPLELEAWTPPQEPKEAEAETGDDTDE